MQIYCFNRAFSTQFAETAYKNIINTVPRSSPTENDAFPLILPTNSRSRNPWYYTAPRDDSTSHLCATCELVKCIPRTSNRLFLFFFFDRSPVGIFITLDVRISISRRCMTGRRGNKFLRSAVPLATHYVRVLPLLSQHPKSVSDNACSHSVKSSRGPFTSDVPVSILIAPTTRFAMRFRRFHLHRYRETMPSDVQNLEFASSKSSSGLFSRIQNSPACVAKYFYTVFLS